MFGRGRIATLAALVAAGLSLIVYGYTAQSSTPITGRIEIRQYGTNAIVPCGSSTSQRALAATVYLNGDSELKLVFFEYDGPTRAGGLGLVWTEAVQHVDPEPANVDPDESGPEPPGPSGEWRALYSRQAQVTGPGEYAFRTRIQVQGQPDIVEVCNFTYTGP